MKFLFPRMLTQVLAALFLSAVLGVSLYAQAAAAAGETPAADAPLEAEAADEGANALASAGEFNILENEDPALWVLMFLMLVGLVVVIERLIVILRIRSNNAKLVQLLTEKLHKDPSSGVKVAEEVADKQYGVEGRIAAVTLKGWDAGEEAMEQYSHAAITAERRFLTSRLAILSTLGNNAPFIGLLGTVLGIMKAFRDLASAADAGPQVVMKGISEALIATATGLAVAIPAVMMFNYFSQVIKGKMSNAEEIVSILKAIRLASKDKKD